MLRGVTLTVPGGEFVTILGPSGCGKTTLLRIVAGLELPDGGRVLLSGRDITAEPANRRPVNTVFQSYALFPHLTVWENIAFGLKARRFPREEIARRVDGAVEMLHLESFPRRHPHQLSGGQRQRVALARALVNEPDVLLLDEPLSSLDAKLRAEVQLELRALQRRLGKTFILVTHDQEEAMSVSDRIFVMRDGRIVQSGPPVGGLRPPGQPLRGRVPGQHQPDPRLAVQRPLPHRPRPARAPLQARLGERPAGHPAGAAAAARRAAGPQRRCRRWSREVIYRGDHLDVFVQPGALRLRLPAGNGSADLVARRGGLDRAAGRAPGAAR